MDHKKVFRKHYISKKNLQLSFGLVSSLLIIISTLGVWLLMSIAINTSLKFQGSFIQEIAVYLRDTQILVFTLIVADTLAIFLLFIFFSNWVAGPIYRIEKTLKDLIETGKAKPITLRKKDFLKETATLVNQLIEKFGKKE